MKTLILTITLIIALMTQSAVAQSADAVAPGLFSGSLEVLQH